MKKIDQAIKTLKNGGVIGFPTETVFGIGASLKHPSAIRRIFKIKKRPRNKPLQILVRSLAQAKKLGKFNKKAVELAKNGWPGPLTLVVYKKTAVPKLVTGGSSKVGLRIPNHKIALELIKNCGPIAATSANLSGEKPFLSSKEIKNSLQGIDLVLPGRARLRKASRVVDAASAKPQILRL